MTSRAAPAHAAAAAAPAPHNTKSLPIPPTSPAPPAPRQYERSPKTSKKASNPEPAQPVPMSLSSILWPFGSPTKPAAPASASVEKPDPARGVEASRRFVKEGVLDPRYKSFARKYTAAIVAMPLAIVLSYHLYQRRFGGLEQKRFPAVDQNATENNSNG